MPKKERKIKPFNLTNDKFLKVFAKRNPEIIKWLVTSIIGLEDKDCNIELLNTVLPPATLNEYLKIVDFNILINKNVIVNLEINSSRFSSVKHRNYVYLSKLINSVLKSGDKSNSLKKYLVYQINLNANDKDKKKGFRLIENYYNDNYEKFLDNIKIIEINLAYYKNLLYTENVKLNDLELIFASLKSESIEELTEILKNGNEHELMKKIIKEVKEIMEGVEIVFTQEEADALARMVMLDTIDDERAEAKEEGIKEGIEQGIEQGIERGIKQRSIEVAKNLLSQKISLDVIKKATGLSMKTIKSLIV